MSSVITEQGQIGYVDGLLVFPSDLLNDNTSQLNGDGEVLASLLGVYDAIPDINPVQLTVPIAGGHINVTVGGAGQWLIVQGRMCDYIPTTNLTQSPPDGTQARTDILCVKYTQQSINGVTRTFQEPDGSDSTTTIFTLAEGVTWDYVEGTLGGGQPSTPSGFELYAVIPVPAAAVTLTPALQFLTVTELGVSINGLTGAITIAGGTDIHVGVSGSTITISLNVAIVDTVNGASGAISIVAGTGISVGTSGGTITITNTESATSVNGLTGAVTIAAGTAIGVGTSGSTITITNDGVSDVNGIAGSVTLAGSGGTSVGVSGSTITISSATGVTQLNGLSGAVNITSTGGSISVTPSGSSVDLEVVSVGAAGAATAPPALAGMVPCMVVMDASNVIAGLLPNTDPQLPGIPSYLGGGHYGMLISSNGTLELHFKVRVKSGAGAQTIGSIEAFGNCFIALDGTTFFTAGTDLPTAWAVNIPDDGAVHTLIFHMTATGANLDGVLGAWLPASASGGLDGTKFDFAWYGF